MRALLFFVLLSAFLDGQGTGAQANQPYVVVNGRTLSERELADDLFRRLGRQFALYRVDQLLYRDEAERLGLTVAEGEVDDFARRRLESLAEGAGGEQAYRATLVKMGTTWEAELARLRDDAETQLLARKIVLARRVDESSLRAAYALRFGRRLHIRQLCAPIRVSEGEDSGYVTMRANQAVERCLAKLRSGADFRALASEASTNPAEVVGADLGIVPLKSLDGAVAAALEGLRAGEWTAPVFLKGGIHIFLVEGDFPQERSFADVREELRLNLLAPRVSEDELEDLRRSLRARASIVWKTGG